MPRTRIAGSCRAPGGWSATSRRAPRATGRRSASASTTASSDGGEISMFYDPMIAKLITWAPTREAAIDAQIAALDSFVIDGISDNVDFLSALMQHPRFRARRPRDRLHRRRISRRLPRRAGRRAIDRGSGGDRRHGRRRSPTRARPRSTASSAAAIAAAVASAWCGSAAASIACGSSPTTAARSR